MSRLAAREARADRGRGRVRHGRRVAAAAIPTLVLLATEPPEQRQVNADAAARMRASVPHADVRPIGGMSHAVFADLGAGAGTVVADWLREQAHRGRRLTPGTIA